MTSVVVHLLTVIIALSFIFLGHIKFTPLIFPEYHEYIRTEFGRYNKEFPFYRQTDWRPYAKNYRLTIGIIEMICGLFLLIGKNFCLFIVNSIILIILTYSECLGFFEPLVIVILSMIVLNAIITFHKINYPIEYIGGSIFVLILLLSRLVLGLRSQHKKSIQPTERKAKDKVQ